MKVLAVVLGYGIFAVCGYLYGHHVGYNEPRVDQRAVEKAVYEALFLQQALDIFKRCTILIV